MYQRAKITDTPQRPQMMFDVARIDAAAMNNSPITLVVMAALRSRCGHYIFVLFLSSSSSWFVPRAIAAVGDWMSTILPHMV